MKYACILSDPPWAFRTYSNKHTTPHRCAEDHYSTMSYDDLCKIDVASWCEDNAALFMWIVDSHVPEGIELAKAWGFQYKTLGLVWDKGRMSMGYWTRKEAEFCYIFTRGKPKVLDHGVRQIIREPKREHSRKPDEQYVRIERLVNGPYLEMFARQQWPGWSQWGNQVDKFEAAA